jgi:hypothetical protein
MRQAGSPFRVVRTEELRRFEMCERALADAYRRQARRVPALGPIGEEHAVHADLLRARLQALGGVAARDTDDEWLLGPIDDPRTLAVAEELALATYHDHLNDHDAETMELLRDHILPAHRVALALHVRGR